MKAFKFVLLLLLGFLALVACGGPATGPLNAPSNLTATPGAGEIVLSWQDNSTAEEGFRIFRRLESDAAFPTEPLGQVGTDVTTYTDTAISSAESYVYQVQAFSSEAAGDFSNLSAPVKPTIGQGKVTLTVLRGSSAQGVVTSNPPGINCVSPSGGVCSLDLDKDSKVTLIANPSSGSQFVGWSGACTGESCIITLDTSKTATATFAVIANELRVTKEGDGEGTVSSGNGQIDCGTKCSFPSEVKTDFRLTATPSSGSVFRGWKNCDVVEPSGKCFISIGGTDKKGAQVIAEFLRSRPAPTIDELTVTPNPMLPSTETVTVAWRVDDKDDADPPTFVTTLELRDNFQTYDLSSKGLEDSIEIPVSTDSRTFTLTAKNAFSGAAGVSREITVTRGSAPTITAFGSSPAANSSGEVSVIVGTPVTLSWTVTGATGTGASVTLNGAPVGATETAFSATPTAVGSTDYTLAASNTFGSATPRTIKVTGTAAPVPPVLTFSSLGGTPEDLSYQVNTPLTLNWTVQNGPLTTLTLNGAALAATATSTPITLPATAATTAYTLAATNAAGPSTPVTKSITTADVPELGEVSVVETPPTSGTYVLTWTPVAIGRGTPSTYGYTLTLEGGTAPSITVSETAPGSGIYTATLTAPPSGTYTLTASNEFGTTPDGLGTGSDQFTIP